MEYFRIIDKHISQELIQEKINPKSVENLQNL